MVDDVTYWHTNDGQISLSNERFKHGNQSLKWEWSSTSTLTYTNPDSFKSIKWANNKCLAFWLFNTEQPTTTTNDESNLSQPISIEFLTATDSQPVAHVWFHVNFYGWRPMGLRYALLPQFKTNLSRIHGIRIYPPSNRSQGTFYINGLNFDYTHNVGPKADYQQPWATEEYIQRLKDDPANWLFNSNNIFHNRSWLIEQQSNASEEDVKKIQKRWLDSLPYGTWSPTTKAEPFQKLQESAEKYGVQLDIISNIPLGKGGFYAPRNALDIQPFLLGPLKRTATSFQCHRHRKTVDSEEGQNTWKLLLQLCDYLLEQGWAEGNMNIEGHLDIGYEIRNYPMCLIYIRDSLNEVNRLQPMLLSAIWIMYGHLLIEQNKVPLSTDIIHNHLTNVSRLIVCLPDQNEFIRRLLAFRYLLTRCFENYIHEPIALDGTVHHHWMCHFEYSSYSLPDILKLISDLNDTEFRFSDNIHRIMRRCVYTLNFCLIENDKIPPNLNGRAGKCLSCNGINITKKCVCMGDPYDRYVAGMLVSMCSKSDKSISKYLKDGIDPVAFEGHLTLNSTAACIHRRSNFYASIVGMGKNRRGLEIYGWLCDTNNYGKYARNCSIFVTRTNEQGSLKYSNSGCAYPGWQWSHWPGTTCLLKSRSELFEGYSNITAKNWLAGGTSIDKQDGMFSNDFFVYDLAFRRSIYCFNNRLTVLTTNMKLLERNRRPVVTTLFQSNFTELDEVVLTLNSQTKITEFPYEQTFDVNQLESIIDHRKLTYYLHPNENQNQSYQIKIRYGEQEMTYCNQQYLIDPKNNPIIDMKSKKFREPNFEDNEKYFQTTKDQFGLGYIEHLQVDDGTGSFVYTILIDQDNLDRWISEHSYEDRDPWSSTDLSRLSPTIILSKTDDQHIFYDRETDTTCYTCFSKDHLNVNIGFVQSFGEPCFAMVRGRGPGTIRVSIATTDFMLKETMWMVLKGQWDNPQLISDDENGSVHVRSEIVDNGDTKITVWQRIYLPVEFHITQA